MRARIAEDEPAATADAKLEAVVHEWVTDAGRPRLGDAAAAPPAGPGPDPRRRPRTALPGLAEVPRGDGGAAAGRARVRGHAVGRRGAAQLRRVPDGVVARPPPVRDRARPAGDGRAPGRLGAPTSRSLTSLALEPLPREAMVELVVGMVPGLPPDAVARIAAAAEGVPLYAVETARMLLDRGVVVRADDGSGYRVTGAIAELADPRVAARARRRPPRRPARGRAPARAAGGGAREVVLARRPGRRQRTAAGADRGGARIARAQGARRRPDRPPLPRARAVRLRPGHGAHDRPRHARPARAQAPASGHRRAPEPARRRRARGGDRRAPGRRLPACSPTTPTPPSCATAHAPTSCARPTGPARSRRRPRPSGWSPLALDLAPDGPEQAALHERAGAPRAAEGRRRRGRARSSHGRSRSTSSAADAARRRARPRASAATCSSSRAAPTRPWPRWRRPTRSRRPAARRRPRPARRAARPALRHDRRRRPAAGSRSSARSTSPRAAACPRCSQTRSTRRACGRLRPRTGVRRRARCCSARCGSRSRATSRRPAMRAYFNLSFEREGVDDYTHDYDTDGLALAERTGDQQWKRSFLLHTSFAAFERGDWDEALRITHEAEESPGAETDHVRARHPAHPLDHPRAARGVAAGARGASRRPGSATRWPTSRTGRSSGWRASEVLAGEGALRRGRRGRRGTAPAGAATLGIGHPAVKASLILEELVRAPRGRPGAPRPRRSSGSRDCRWVGSSPRLRAHRDLLRALLAAAADAARAVPDGRSRPARRTEQPLAARGHAGRAGGTPASIRDAALAEARAILSGWARRRARSDRAARARGPARPPPRQ